MRASLSGVVKKTKVNQHSSSNVKQGKSNETGPGSRKGKRPAVPARMVKQLAKKRKLDASSPENTRKTKKQRK